MSYVRSIYVLCLCGNKACQHGTKINCPSQWSVQSSKMSTKCLFISAFSSKFALEKLMVFFLNFSTAWKVPKYGVFSGPYFPVFELNTEIYSVNLRIQSEYKEIRTRKSFVFGTFTKCRRLIKPLEKYSENMSNLKLKPIDF